MGATLLYRNKFSAECEDGRTITIYMDLFTVPGGQEKGLPEGYKFSWIAFDSEDTTARVLFDCHPPKGPHLHVDMEPVGISYSWKSLEAAENFFFEKVQERFGKFKKEELR